MSYSCGKDSTLELHKMILQGHTPVALLVMVNENVDRSFFHGADYDIFCNCAGIVQDLYPIRGERERLFLTDRRICVST